jgi:trehalose 6-phosphate synthase/phosphatase
MDKLIREEISEKYRNANCRLILLDYDGTLVNHTPIPYTDRLSAHLFDILTKIVDTPQTELFIITGRSYKDIDKILDHLSINIVAEHGAVIKEGGIWENQINDDGYWKKSIFPILVQITTACPESFIEDKAYSLAWHYRNAELQSGLYHSRELIRILESITDSYSLKILDGNKVVEIMTREVGKGGAVRKIFEQNNYDFTLSIGDDVTDEEMFEYFLNIKNAFTIKVGKGSSCAKYNFPGINNVISLLKHLSS